MLREFVRNLNAPFLLCAAAIYLAAFALAFWMKSRRAGVLQRVNQSVRAWHRALLVLAIAYFSVYSYLSVERYYKLLCGAWDLGIFDSMFHNALHGRLFQDFRGPFDHFVPVYLAAVPLYALWPDARLLLVLQSFVFAIAVLPLYLLAREVSGNKVIASVVGVLYLLYPLVGQGNLYDYHALSFSPLCFFTMLLFMVRRKWSWYWAFLALTLLVKESEAILVFGAGLYLLSRRDYLRGAITAGAAVAWFFAVTLLVIPAITGEAYRHMSRYEGLETIALSALSTPASRAEAAGRLAGLFSVCLYALVPLSFLAARRWRPFLLVFAPAFVVSVASKMPLQYALPAHYGITVASAVFGAAALSVERLPGLSMFAVPSALPVFAIVVAALSNLVFSFPANERYIYPAAHFEIARSGNVMSCPLPVTRARLDFYRVTQRERLFFAVRDAVPQGSKIGGQDNLILYFVNNNEVKAPGHPLDVDFQFFDFDDTYKSVFPPAAFALPEAAPGDFTSLPRSGDALRERYASDPDNVIFLDLSTSERGSFLFVARRDKWRALYDNLLAAHARRPDDAAVTAAISAIDAAVAKAGVPPPR